MAAQEHADQALTRHRQRLDEAQMAAGEAWQEHDLVFPNTLGGPMDGSNLLRFCFRPLLNRAGLPLIRFHDLRHTAATLLLGQGIHPKVVAEMLGHSTITITMDTYSHVLPEMQRTAAASIDRLLQPLAARRSNAQHWLDKVALRSHVTTPVAHEYARA